MTGTASLNDPVVSNGRRCFLGAEYHLQIPAFGRRTPLGGDVD
jgi:hypothetical protein